MWRGNANEALISEAGHLAAGRALDVGCGEGADSVWLASRGWHVAALDISPKAVQRTEALATEADVQVQGVAAGLLDASLVDSSPQILHDLPALAACGELLSVRGDVDPDDPNGGADHGGGGGQWASSANTSLKAVICPLAL